MAIESRGEIKSYELLDKASLLALKESFISTDNRADMAN